MLFPGPYRVPRAGFATKIDLHEHRRAHRVPRSVAVRDAGPRDAARHRGTPDGHRPDRAPPAQPVAPTTTFRTRIPTACRTTASRRSRRSSRRWRCSTTKPSAPSRPTARVNGRYLGVGLSNYVEPSTPGYGVLRDRSGDDPHRAFGHRQRVRRGRLRPGNSLETTVVQLTADALGVKIEDVNTIQGDTAVTGFGAGVARQPERVDDGRRGARDRGILRERIRAIAAHKLEAAVEDIELADSRATVRGTPAIGISLARAGRARVLRARRAPARCAGRARGERALHRRRRRSIWVNATHVCTCEVDVTTGAREAAALHRERGLRPDDQPERRRGPDRGWRRARHRRRAARAPRVRRGRQPARDDVHGLPAADRGRRARHRVRAHRDTEPRPGRLQGRGRRRRDRRAARGRQRGGRRARAVRRDGDAPAAHAVAHRGAPRPRKETVQ